MEDEVPTIPQCVLYESFLPYAAHPVTKAAFGALSFGSPGGQVCLRKTLLDQPDTCGIIAIAIRQGQTRFSAADLDGVFSGIDYSSETDTGYSVAVTFDGAGNYSQVNICNSAGVIAAAPGDSGTCSVTPAGAVANDSGGLGGISADGNTLLMAPFRTGETPAIAVTIK